MNETTWIFVAIAAYGIGHAIAWFFKDMGKTVQRWGGLLVILTFPSIFMMLVASAQIIAGVQSIVLSMIFATGFLIRMVKRNG